MESTDRTANRTGDLTVTDRTSLRRHARKGSHARDDLYAVLDAGFVCHLGLQTPDGPMVLPTSYGRSDDQLYLHGSVVSRSLRAALDQVPMCVTVTHVDGVVIARSMFEHAVNYRCAIVYGVPTVLAGADEKAAGMRVISDHIAAGQWGYAREPTGQELAQTTVLVMSLEEASVKVRTGPPADGQGPDADRPVWAGEIPLRTFRLDPVPDPTLPEAIALPRHLAEPGVARGAMPWRSAH